jgi:hypothetical protein
LYVPNLSTYNYAPFVQLHYNAVDLDGNQFNVGASSRLTGNISGGNTVITLQSVKSFGYDGQTIEASSVSIGGTPASTSSTIRGTISYSAKTITFSTAVDSGFVSLANTGAIVKVSNLNPKIIVTDTLPKVSTIVTGSTSILDVIRSSLEGQDLRLFSAGGVIEFDKPEMFGFLDGDLEGETSEGTLS